MPGTSQCQDPGIRLPKELEALEAVVLWIESSLAELVVGVRFQGHTSVFYPQNQINVFLCISIIVGRW